MPLFVNKSYFFLYSVTDPSHFSLIVLVLLVTKHSRSSFNVLIKGTTVISNPCYFVLWLYVEKINPYLRTFSDDCVRLIREDSVLAASREHEGICISWCCAASRVWPCAHVQVPSHVQNASDSDQRPSALLKRPWARPCTLHSLSHRKALNGAK